MADVVYDLEARIGVDSSQLGPGLDSARDQITGSGVGGAARQVGATVSKAIGAGIKALVGFGTSAVSVGMDFDATMSQVRAVSGANAEQFEALREQALYMGRTTKFTATEAAEALMYMGYAGWDAGQMAEGLPAVMTLAAASGEDLATVSDIVTDALTAYGLGAEDAAMFANVLAATATNANTNVGMLGETFKYAAPLAGALHYSLQDTAVAFGLMANSGIKASMAGTALRGFLSRLAKPTKESQEAMDDLGISLTDEEGNILSFMDVMKQMRTSFKENLLLDPEVYQSELAEMDQMLEAGHVTEEEYESMLKDLNIRAFGEEAMMARYAAMLGGQRALAGLLAIVNATDKDFEDLTQTIYGASEAFALVEDGSVIPLAEAQARGLRVMKQYNGAAEAMQDVMIDNLAGDVTLLKSAWEGMQITFADKFVPEIRRVMPQIIELVSRFTEKLGDMDFSKLADTLVTVAEGALKIIEYLIEHSDEVIKAVGGIMGAFFLGKGANAANGLLSLFGLGGANAGGKAMVGALKSGAKLLSTGSLGSPLLAASPLAAIFGGGLLGFAQSKDYRGEVEGRYGIGVSKSLQEAEATVAQLEADIAAKKAEIESLSLNGSDTTWAYIELNTLDATLVKAKEDLASMQDQNADAEGWGEDLMANMASGIDAGAALWLKPAVIGAAALVASYLHHSEPDVGPLAHDSEWMPDMMQGFAAQIRAGGPGIASALDDAFAVSPSVGMGASGGFGAGRIYNFNIRIDGDIGDPRAKAEALMYEMRAILDREEAALA